MPKPEYDSFAYEGNVVELVEALDEDQKDLRSRFDKGALFCPECMQARLTFTRRTSRRRAFLSTKRPAEDENNAHAPDCSHAYKPASKRQTIRYYAELTEEQVMDKLDAAINRFLQRNQNPGRNRNAVQQGNNPAIAAIRENGQEIRRRLPMRSIYSIYDISDDELDVPVLLYGDVKLASEEKKSEFREGKTYFKVSLLNKETDEHIRYFNLNELNEEIDPTRIYHAVIIATFWRDEKKKLCSKVYRVNNREAIRYVRLP